MESNKLEGEALVAAHKEAARNILLLSIAFPIAVIVIVVGHLWAIKNQITNLDTGKVATVAAERLGAVWPDIESHLTYVTQKVEPALGKALETEIAAMAPVLEKRLQTDVDMTLKTAERDFSQAVEMAISQMETNQRNVLLAKAPVLETDRAAQEHVLGASRNAIATWSNDRFHTAIDDHVEAMASIRNTLRKGYTSDSDVPADPQDAMLVWLELLNESVGGEAVVAALDGKDLPSKPKAHGRK